MAEEIQLKVEYTLALTYTFASTKILVHQKNKTADLLERNTPFRRKLALYTLRICAKKFSNIEILVNFLLLFLNQLGNGTSLSLKKS